MSRYGKLFACCLACTIAAFAAGYITSKSQTQHSDLEPPFYNDPNVLNISVPTDYFATLPSSPDGDQRLINVDTFTFETKAKSGELIEKTVVLPRVAMSDSH